MIKAFFAQIAVGIMAVLTSIGVVAPSVTPQKVIIQKEPVMQVVEKVKTEKFGTAVPSTPALVDTYLASSITANATTMTLASGMTNDGTALAGFMCFTIDANTPQVEYVCGTASSTTVYGLTRGIDMTNPNATTSLSYTHRRFAAVQATDYPAIQFISRKLNGTDSFDTALKYVSSSSSFITSPDQLASKAYVDSIQIAGGVIADTSTPGISILATQAQTAAGTATSTYGTSTYSLIPQNRYFNATSSATTTVPVTQVNGTLQPAFIDQTGNYVWNGTHSFSATTSLATTTFSIIPTMPTTTPTLSTQVASKNYVDMALFKSGVTTRAFNAASGTSTIAHGLGHVPKFIRITTNAVINGTNNVPNFSQSIGTYNGSTTATVYLSNLSSNSGSFENTDTSNIINVGDQTGGNYQTATATVDGTNINLTWTVHGSPATATVVSILWEAY